MPSLKDLKVRINSVKSTQKITSAMKMVAAAKLRRAQEQAEAARPYAERMEKVLGSLAASVAGRDGAPALLAGTGKDQVHLIVVMTSDRGLCGAFNSSIVRQARRLARELKGEGKTLKILCVGRKARDQLRRGFAQEIIGTIEAVGKPKLNFEAADKIATRIRQMFDHGEFDVCTIVYNKFKSAITQIVTTQQLIPFAAAGAANENTADRELDSYEYEPEEDAILAELLPRNIGMQVFRALLENAASEEGARMSAMDSATRNAGDMINRLTITYNRSRQAYITKELIEIISGAEAL
ncbi:MAG TPA: F0F1 ATP synthase subunit gamma [Dongiaceae bacterium]|jgi:F-type H+-transporting ATPase subunit gamma